MEKSPRTQLILPLFVCLLFAALPLRTGDILRRPASESFLEEATGILFPSRVDTFEKVMVRVNPDLRTGTDIAYENESGALADVYVYRPSDGPLTEEAFLKHAKDTLSRIANMAARSKIIRNVTQLHGEPFPFRDGVCAGIYRIKLEKEDLISRVYLLRRGDRIIKIRVTVPVDPGSSGIPADPFGTEIMKLAGAGQPPASAYHSTTGE